jgi:hypothetical protein
MENRTMYCPKCDHNVTVTLSPPPLHDGHASLPDSGEMVCLDFGPQCTSGKSCAVSALPAAVMGVRLARSGLRPDQLERVQALCEGCERVQQLEIVDETHALCPACDTVNLWTMIRLDGEEWIAVTGRKAEAELG